MSQSGYDEHLETVLSLAFVAEFRDSDTSQHLRRISHVARLIGAAWGLDEDTVAVLGLAAPMHDVGQVAIPDDILLKPGRLTEDERRVMQDHTVIGHRLLSSGATPVLKMACDIARSHHERWDGLGYPDGLEGDATPLPARIVNIADVFDALLTKRIYKQPHELKEAEELLRLGAGMQFDPEVVEAFFRTEPAIAEVYSAFDDEEEGAWVA
jgi:putative two-component system response regulator